MRVNNALGTILGATNIDTQSGIARVTLPKKTISTEVVSTIEKAGYYVTEIAEETVNAIEKTASLTEHGIVGDHCLD